MFESTRFNLEQKVLSGHKTQTRRFVPEKIMYAAYNERDSIGGSLFDILVRMCPIHVGEQIAIAQSYDTIGYDPDMAYGDSVISNSPGWRNKMFVRADYMPHIIQITSIQVQGFSTISWDDSIAEGIEVERYPLRFGTCFDDRYYIYDNTKRENIESDSPVAVYLEMLSRLYTSTQLGTHPYVYAYQFELIQ